ncbi:MAG TPA: hypothetical protein VJ729_16490 [Nitrososphaeraceae archaeon]|nr:hypothetical protein [Nitrososphaeraceae archaeon]
MGIIDLSFVKDSSAEKHGRYICIKCMPTQYMYEVTDPKETEFLGANRHRYRCVKCGYTNDSTDPVARVEEMITTAGGDSSDNSNSNNNARKNNLVFEPIHDEHRDDVRGTKLGREYFEQTKPASSKPLEYDPDPEDDDRLRAMGFQIHRTEVKSSVTGRTYVKEYR